MAIDGIKVSVLLVESVPRSLMMATARQRPSPFGFKTRRRVGAAAARAPCSLSDDGPVHDVSTHARLTHLNPVTVVVARVVLGPTIRSAAGQGLAAVSVVGGSRVVVAVWPPQGLRPIVAGRGADAVVTARHGPDTTITTTTTPPITIITTANASPGHCLARSGTYQLDARGRLPAAPVLLTPLEAAVIVVMVVMVIVSIITTLTLTHHHAITHLMVTTLTSIITMRPMGRPTIISTSLRSARHDDSGVMVDDVMAARVADAAPTEPV